MAHACGGTDHLLLPKRSASLPLSWEAAAAAAGGAPVTAGFAGEATKVSESLLEDGLSKIDGKDSRFWISWKHAYRSLLFG